MKKFLVIYHAPAQAAMEKMMNATPEEKMEGMKPWMEWMGGMGSSLVDGGAPLMPGTVLLAGGAEEANTPDLTGYSLIEAEDLEDAKSKLKNHPHLDWIEGCKVEVLQCMPMGM